MFDQRIHFNSKVKDMVISEVVRMAEQLSEKEFLFQLAGLSAKAYDTAKKIKKVKWATTT